MSDFIMDQAEFASLVSGEGVLERVIVIDPKDKDVDIVKIDNENLFIERDGRGHVARGFLIEYDNLKNEIRKIIVSLYTRIVNLHYIFRISFSNKFSCLSSIKINYQQKYLIY